MISRTARLQALFAGLVVGSGLILISAPVASARSYTVYGCRTPSGAKAPMSGWQGALDPADNTAHGFWGGSCPGPVYLKLDPSWAHIHGAYAYATFIAPADTTIGSYSIWRAVRLMPSDGYVYQMYALSAGRWVLMDGCSSNSSCRSTYGSTSNLAASSNLLHQNAPIDTTQLQFRMVCARTGGCPKVYPSQSDAVWIWSTAVTLADNYSPQFTGPPSGPLVSPGVLSGVVPVTVGATDRGGGVYRAQIEVDGRVMTSQPLGADGSCNAPFLVTVPCELSASGTLALNTAKLADGTHSVMLLVYDAAGNTAAWGPITITTVNNPCSPVPAAGGLDMNAAFEVVKTKRVVVPTRTHVHKQARVHKRAHVVTHVSFHGAVTTDYQDPPVVVGTLKTPNGAPVGGASACVAARDDYPGAPLTPLGTIATNAAGGFRYQPAAGPSRTLYFIHRVPGGAIYTTVHMAVRVPVKVHLHRRHLKNGQVMTWSGRLPGPVPEGLQVSMQVWRGTFWQIFETVSVARSGAWVGRYRFRFSSGVQHYRMRLKIRRQSGYPYAANASRPFRVTVVG